MPNACAAHPEGVLCPSPSPPSLASIRLSFCLIVRNCEAKQPGALEQALQSVRDRAPTCELVCVDTCSSDDGIDVVSTRYTAQQLQDAVVAYGLRVIWAGPAASEGARIRFNRPHGQPQWAGVDEAAHRALRSIFVASGWADDLDSNVTYRHTSIGWGSGTLEICRRYADIVTTYRGPRGDWTVEMDAFDDAAAARQHSFDISHGIWCAWIDADDIIPGPVATRDLLRINCQPTRPPTGAKVVGVDAAGGLAESVDPDESLQRDVPIEDVLRHFDEVLPDVEMIKAAYLYRPDAHGRAIEWQPWRERIIRWRDIKTGVPLGLWGWRSAGHELCVPLDPNRTFRDAFFHGMLYVHQKLFTPADIQYNLARHCKILLQAYEDGARGPRDCLYLAGYAGALGFPERQWEFLEAATQCSTSPLDRMRAAVDKARWFAARGLYVEAIDQIGIATTHGESLPDPWIVGGQIAFLAKDYLRAITYLRRAVAVEPGAFASLVSPRVVQLDVTRLLVLALTGHAKECVAARAQDAALAYFQEAHTVAMRRLNNPALIPEERLPVLALQMHALNAARSQECAIRIWQHWRLLLDNDETLKAVDLVGTAPHTLQDHPLIQELEAWTRIVTRHCTDPQAYRDFYCSDMMTGAIPSPVEWLIPEHSQPRARYLIDWVRHNAPRARVVEIGPFDGVVGIPFLRACPEVTYVGVDASEGAAQAFRARIEADGLTNRAQILHVDDPLNVPAQLRAAGLTPRDADDWGAVFVREQALSSTFVLADVIVAFEIIEHVPDPVRFVRALLDALADDGRLFLSTPWGAFDDGSPPNTNVRDPRGHVRAMTPRDIVTVVEQAGGVVEDLGCGDGMEGIGDTLHLRARRVPLEWRLPAGRLTPDGGAQPVEGVLCSGTRKPRPTVAFAVPGALWDWNGSSVEATGMGASEETIVYLSRALTRARDDLRVEVYGPVPNEEVWNGVAYWPHAQLRKLPKNPRVIVSRAPSYGRRVLKATDGRARMWLWLQDAFYPDLNAETAALYQKIIVLTEWHRDHLATTCNVPLDRFVVIPNFLLREHFTRGDAPPREAAHFVYASSPDRGLLELLHLWPLIRRTWPEATLDIAYGWEGCKALATVGSAWTLRYRELRTRYETVCYQPGVRERGRLSHRAIAREMQRSRVWLYPTAFAETFCSNAIKARAAGAVPVCPAYAGLATTAASAVTAWVDKAPGSWTALEDWIHEQAEQIVARVWEASNIDDGERRAMEEAAQSQYDITAILPQWRDLLEI